MRTTYRLLVSAMMAATFIAVADEPPAPPADATTHATPAAGERPARPPKGERRGPGKDGPRRFHGPRGPRNVSFVIDCSAQQAARFERMREFAIEAVRHLAPTDIVSVVAFDGTATVVVPAQEAGDGEAVIAKIKELKSSGDSALFAGISAAAEEVRKNTDKNFANDVVVFGGFGANVGPTGVEELKTLRESLAKEKIRVFPPFGMFRGPDGGPNGGPNGGPGWKGPRDGQKGAPEGRHPGRKGGPNGKRRGPPPAGKDGGCPASVESEPAAAPEAAPEK